MIVHSIFDSIDGEINRYHQGRLTTFLRLSGCNLNCEYCDTDHNKGTNYGDADSMDFSDLIDKLYDFNLNKLTITGGEPLLWGEELSNFILELRAALWSHNSYKLNVSIETNGTIDMGFLPRWVNLIVDYKLPSAKVDLPENYIENFFRLQETDIVKFVVANSADFANAADACEEINMFANPIMAFSPVHGKLKPKTLLDWIQEMKLDAVLNLQVHKIIGVD